MNFNFRISFLAVLVFAFFSCKNTRHLAKIEPSNTLFSKEKNLETDAEVEALIAPYQKEIRAKMDAVIGQCAYEISKAAPESLLGNFCADAIHQKAEEYTGKSIDFATQNYGGIRIPYLAAGDITRGRVYELMPFENRLVILEIPGDTLLKFIEHITGRGGWPVSASLRYVIFDDRPEEITINGKPLDTNQTYRIALPDYIANGGDKCDFLKDLPPIETTKLIRDIFFEVIEEHSQAGKPIAPKIDGRIGVRNN